MILDLSTAASNFDKTKRQAGGVEEWGRREKWGIIEITALRQRQQEVITASVLDKGPYFFSINLLEKVLVCRTKIDSPTTCTDVQ